MAVRSYITLLFTELFRSYQKTLHEQLVSQIDHSINNEIISYMDAHYQEVTLSMLADHFNFSIDYMGKLIKQITGNSFTDFVKDKRLKQACLLLKMTSKSVQEIVSEIGYSNISYFYKQFKQKYEMTPDAYRSRYGK